MRAPFRCCYLVNNAEIVGTMGKVRLALTFDHTAGPRESVALGVAAEDAGADEVWIPETWGFDAPTLMGALAMRTTRIGIGAVLPVYSRTPALIAQTVAGADALSGGRSLVGLGTSGPQVVEGWHGVPFLRPLGELREAVTACRMAWAREVLAVDGPRPVPLPAGEGTGMGKALRMITRPERPAVPIVLTALAPGAVRLAAEVADGWWPLFISPGAITGQWAEPLGAGRALRDPALPPLAIMASRVAWVGVGEGARAARAAARREIAFYVGSMGSRERNYYRDAVGGMGFGDECAAIQDAALDGRRADAEALVTDAMLEELALIGDAARVREGIAALSEAGVTTIALSAATPDPLRVLSDLQALITA